MGGESHIVSCSGRSVETFMFYHKKRRFPHSIRSQDQRGGGGRTNGKRETSACSERMRKT